MTPFDIHIEIAAPFADRVDADALIAVAAATLAAEGIAAGMTLSLIVTGDDDVRELNRRYRGLDEPTDVLAFGETPAEGDAEPWIDASAGEPAHLGDVVVALPYAARQAERAARPLSDELAHLVAHGILHLLGYDHEEPDEERAMRDRERAILGGRYREPA